MAGAHIEQMARRGIRALAPAAAAATLGGLWHLDDSEVAVADADWAVYRGVFEGAAVRGLLDELAPRPVEAAPAAAPVVASLPERARRKHLRTLVTDVVRKTLGLSASDVVDPQQGFFDMGLDSLMAVSLAESVAEASGLEVVSSVVFDHPTVERLADHPTGTVAPSESPVAAVAAEVSREPIAIVGMACRFPGRPAWRPSGTS